LAIPEKRKKQFLSVWI